MMASNPLTIRRHVRFTNGERGRRKLRATTTTTSPASQPIPRISRLMALAIVMDEMVRSGKVASHAELARIAHVSPSRLAQIMSLVNLAPDLQEAILFLPAEGDKITERSLRRLVAETDWVVQRAAWETHAPDP